MSIAGNIEDVLALRMTASTGTLLPGELAIWYPRCRRKFAGVNAYYGISDTNLQVFQCSGGQRAMNLRHRDLFSAVTRDILHSPIATRTLNISLEPLEDEKPYEFVAAHLDLVRRLARDIREYQDAVAAPGSDATRDKKHLKVIVRYASEMNDAGGSNRYAGQPDTFRESYRIVREIFRQEAPAVQFAFSPAIRSDLKQEDIAAYWPGDDSVDIVSCTWYIGDDDQFDGAAAFFRDYFREASHKNKPLGIDEFGGCQTLYRDTAYETGQSNDAFLQRMSDVIYGLRAEGIHFSYATLFLESKWGADAQLEWL